MPCAVYKRPRQMLVKVGSGSSGDSFKLKGAEWADVKAASTQTSERRPASVPSTRGHRFSSSVNILLRTGLRAHSRILRR